MSLRTFVVFQDTPTSDIPKSKTSNITPLAASSVSNSTNLNNAPTLTTAEKENLHPLTGERAGPSNVNSKKRKTSVLATKVHMPLGSKKQDSKEVQPDAKKRKSSSLSTVKSKGSAKKDGKASGSSRKVTKKPSRKVSPMPKLEEELDVDKERECITQAEIDSRCYELTVQPLADVSQAYEQSASIEAAPRDEGKVKFQHVKESSVEPEIRDYFSPPPSSRVPLGPTLLSSQPPLEDRGFSTPERKQIYAAFTFTSPSPTSERFSRTTRAGQPTTS